MFNMKPNQLRAIRLRMEMSQQEFGELLYYPARSAGIRVSELERGIKRIVEIKARRAIQLYENRTIPKRIKIATRGGLLK